MREKIEASGKSAITGLRAGPARRSAVRLLADTVFLIALAGLFLASAAGAASAWLPAFEVFGNLQGHLAAAALALALAALAARSRRWAIVAASVFGLNAAAVAIRIAPVAACPVQTAATGQQAVRILTHNISRENRDVEAFERVVARQRPDVIVLEEFVSAHASLLDSLRAQYPYQAVCDRNADCDVVMVSRYPLRSRQVVGDDDIAVVQATVAVGAHELILLGTHVDQPFAGSLQSSEFRTLARIVSALPANAVIVGDFNSVPWSANMARYARDAGVCASNASVATWPQWLGPFGIPIDHVFLKPGVQLLGIATLDGTGSDHKALLATVGIR